MLTGWSGPDQLLVDIFRFMTRSRVLAAWASALLAGLVLGATPASAHKASQRHRHTRCAGQFHAGHWPPACWRPYGSSSPFNQPLPAHPGLLPSSAAIVSRVLGFGLPGNLLAGVSGSSSDWGHPSYYSRPVDPQFTIHCTESWGRCQVEGMRIRIPDAARPAGGGDGHMAVIDQADGWEYDFWQVLGKPRGGGRLEVSWGGRLPLRGNGLGGAATAAGFGLQAGIIRAAELRGGRIDHALFMTVRCTTGRSVYPASGGGAACPVPLGAPAMGMRFQLAMSDAQIAALPLPGWKKTILRALSHYGAYVGDTGGSGIGFEFESGATYTSFGYPDPMVRFARGAGGIAISAGRYVFDLAKGVDWSRLRVVDPCLTRHVC